MCAKYVELLLATYKRLTPGLVRIHISLHMRVASMVMVALHHVTTATQIGA